MSAGGASARVFVALTPDATLTGRLVDRVAPVLPRAAFRPTRPEGVHLTLAFLGEVARERLAGLAEALRASLADVRGPSLRLSGTGAFPGKDRARVLWVGVTESAGPGRLAACHASVRAGLARVGLTGDERPGEPFRPHLTVARARGRPARAPEAFLALEVGLDWRPEEVELVESELRPEGPRYRVLATFPLARAPDGA